MEIKSSHIKYDYVKFVSRLSNLPYLIIVSIKYDSLSLININISFFIMNSIVLDNYTKIIVLK